MCWFLKRWSFISEGLFDVIEDAKMGVVSSFQDQQHVVVVDKIPNHSSGRDTPFRLPVFVDHEVTRCESPTTTTAKVSTPPPHLQEEEEEEEEKNSLKNDSKNNGSDELGLDKGLDYGEIPFPSVLFEFVFFKKSFLSFLFPADDKSSFIIPTVTHNIDENSVYSATARKFLFSFPDSNSLFWELTFICSSSR